MGGGLMQLVAYGAQDIYLTGNPQITFFKVVYRRHTNFSMELIQQVVEGTSTIKNGTSGQGDVTISRNGDLIYDMYVAMKDGAPVGNGDHIIKQVDLEIGGQLIDRHTLEWNQIWWELTTPTSKGVALRTMLGRSRKVHSRSPGQHIQAAVFVPLQFWFCLNPGLALPLIALQYHEVNVKITTRNLLELINTDYAAGNISVTDLTHFDLYADYIFLDTDERRRFAQVSHEYLIIQVQRSEGQIGQTSHELKFNHPVKELIWFSRDTDAGTGTITPAVGNSDARKNVPPPIKIGTEYDFTIKNNNDWFNYNTSYTEDGPTERIYGQLITEAFGTMTLTINGHERFSARNASYFRLCQPLQAGHKGYKRHIYCYSFALKPEEHQPSGTCNFSRIDNAQMMFTNPNKSGPMTVFALNYNILHIMSGMGGLAYSN